jgi:hypothetical protein
MPRARREETCRHEMADYGQIELAEPSEDDVAQVRLLIEKVAEA